MRAQDLKSCTYCASEIPARATICCVCTNHQSKWRSELRYYAGIVGLLSAIAAAVSFVLTSAGEIRKALVWHDELRIIGYDDREGPTFHNAGDGAVLISDISFIAKFPGNDIIMNSSVSTVNKKLEAGETHTHPALSPLSGEDSKELGRIYRIATTKSEAQFEKQFAYWLAQGQTNIATCIGTQIYSSDSSTLKNFKARLGSDLRTYPIEAVLRYFSPKSNKFIELPFKLEGLLTIYQSPESCKLIN